MATTRETEHVETTDPDGDDAVPYRDPRLPEVLRQIAMLASRINRKALPQRSAASEGRRAAVTLRLDAERHFRLKMAGLMLNRSAQVIMTEALDKYLSEMPEAGPSVKSALR